MPSPVTSNPTTSSTLESGTLESGTVASAVAIDRARAAGRAALVGYLPAGFPDLDTSVAAMVALAEGGCDVIEIGLPYSDPVMDGPVIAAASAVALARGTRVADVLDVAARVTAAAPEVAVLVMTYWNPILRRGVASVSGQLAAAGVAGLITPDLLPEEVGAWLAASEAHGLERVFLVAPSSTPERLAATAAACTGFTYAASTMGVTGVRGQVGADAAGLVARTRAAGAERVCVGLGVSTGAQAAEVAGFADGVIVGSALVRALADPAVVQAGETVDVAAGVARVRELAAELAAGVRGRAPVPGG